ncbi:unnamed protein product [Rhizoctonia solani]|nr:unnamed protein product [Rhizoctonia solani]
MSLLTPPMSSRPSEKENVPFTQSPTSPKVLREAFQPSPRPPMSPQQVRWSPRAPASPRSSPNRSRGHLRPANLHPPSLLTRSRTQRVSFAQKDSHHVYTTPLRSLPSYSSKPPGFIAARSILKAKTPERVVVPPSAPEAPPIHGRDMTPTPDDPLHCATYLSSPVSVIVLSVSVTPQPNRIDSEYGNSCGPLPMSLHDIAEAYTLMLARMRLQAMTIGPDGNPTEVEISSDLPLLDPIRKHHAELALALARDVGRALIRPASFSPTPYQQEEFNDWSSDYSSDVFGSSSPPGSPSGPTQKRGLTAAEVKYARDLSLVSQSAIRVLAVIFHEPAISSHFTDHELADMLRVLISIPNTMPLPTPNPRKTHTAALWALQMVRLPLSALKQPGVAPSLFDALQMAIQGKLGREGKKGSTSEGLTALQCLSTHYPCIFAPMLPSMIADVIRCLSSPMVLIRQRAALALGGMVQGLFDWEEEEEVTSNDAGRKFDPTPIGEVRKAISEAILEAFDLQTGTKNAIMLKTIKDIISQFGPEPATQPPRVGDTPHWAFSVLASLVTLLERNFFRCGAMHTAIATCAMIAFNAKKAAIRAAGGLLWSCVVWAWKRFDEQDPARGEGEESLKNEKMVAQVVVEHVGFGVVAALMGAMDRSEAVKARRLRRVTRTVRAMITENCQGAPELFARLLANEESSVSSAWSIDRKLVPTSLLIQPLVGADLKALGIAVNSNLAQGVKAEDVRPLTMDERVSEWSLLFAAWKQFPGTVPMTNEGEAPELLFTTWRAILLATTHVKEHIPCFVSIAEALTAFANSKYDEPNQMAITLNFVRRLWGIVHEVFFNPLSSNNLLADFSADLIQTLAQRPPDLGNKVVRDAWVTLLGEVLASGALDSADTLCDVLPEALWGSVYAGVVGKYAEEPNFEAGLVLCGVPFNESYSWVLSEDDWTAWSSLAHALIINEGDQVFSNLLTMVASGQSASIPTASTLRPLSILLSFPELPIAESDTTFLNLLGMANDRLRGEYSSCLSPDALEAALELISALKGILTPDPICLEIIEAVQKGMMMWIEDEQFMLTDQEFNDGPILFYAHAMQGLSSLPSESLDLNKLAPFLASAFARIPPPGAGPLAFSLFWNQKFHDGGVPVPEILKPCLRSIMNVEDLIEAGISLGTQLEETQVEAIDKGAEGVDTTMESPNTSMVKVDESTGKVDVGAVESLPVAQESSTETESSVEETCTEAGAETISSSLEEVDQLADDSDLVEETIVYEPPKRTKSTTPEVVTIAPTQEDSQCVPDSQPETAEVSESLLTPSQTLLVCESPRKRKYADLSPPSKRPKGLFIPDTELGGSLPTLRFPTPASQSGSNSGLAAEKSVFYSPSKYDIPPPAWSPTGTLQPLPDVSSPKAKGNTSLDADSSADISDFLNNDLGDLPDITMSLPMRKKRMTLIVEVPRVQDVLKRWSSDSATRPTFGAGISSTPKSVKVQPPERAHRTRSWSRIPSVMDSSIEFESTPSRPAKRRRSDRESMDGDRTITPSMSSRVLRSHQKGLPSQANTPKPAEPASDMFDGESPEETPSLRRVKSLPLAEKFAGMDLKKVGRVATLALARTESQISNVSVEMKDPDPEPEQPASKPSNTPVTRTATLESLMVDAEALAQLDMTELLKQQEMLAAMREQVAKALALKRELSVGSGAKPT